MRKVARCVSRDTNDDDVMMMTYDDDDVMMMTHDDAQGRAMVLRDDAQSRARCVSCARSRDGSAVMVVRQCVMIRKVARAMRIAMRIARDDVQGCALDAEGHAHCDAYRARA